MIARDDNAGAGSDRAVGASSSVSVSTPSSPIKPSRLRPSSRTPTTRAEVLHLGKATSRVRVADATTTKAGELLVFRPRSLPRPSHAAMTPVTTETQTVVILYGGREFHTTRARAESFFVWARAVAASGQAALVPLGHKDGVDLLLITGNTPLP